MATNFMEHTSYIAQIMQKIFFAWQTKIVSGIGLTILSFMFDALQRDALLALLILIIIDFFSALLAAYNTDEAIRSAKIFRTALKIVVYFLLVSAGFLAERAIPLGIIDEIILGFLVATELISVLENAARAGYAVPTGLLNTLKDFKMKK